MVVNSAIYAFWKSTHLIHSKHTIKVADCWFLLLLCHGQKWFNLILFDAANNISSFFRRFTPTYVPLRADTKFSYRTAKSSCSRQDVQNLLLLKMFDFDSVSQISNFCSYAEKRNCVRSFKSSIPSFIQIILIEKYTCSTNFPFPHLFYWYVGKMTKVCARGCTK